MSETPKDCLTIPVNLSIVTESKRTYTPPLLLLLNCTGEHVSGSNSNNLNEATAGAGNFTQIS